MCTYLLPAGLSPIIPPNTPIAWTSKPDIGRALAELALLALAPETAPSIPEYVRIPNYSAAEYARAAGEAPSANEHEKDLASVEARLRKEKAEGDEKTPENYIRCADYPLSLLLTWKMG